MEPTSEQVHCELINCPRNPEIDALRSQASRGDIYKNLLIFCMGMLITLGGVYLTHVQNTVSRAEVDQMIINHPEVVTLKTNMAAMAIVQTEQVTRLQRVNDVITNIAIKLHVDMSETAGR